MTTHIINRQIIDLKVRSDRNAFRLQQQVRAVYEEDILPLMNELLDELCGPGEVLRIDRLDLDLGTIQAAQMGQQLKERLREALREQLRKSRAEASVYFSAGNASNIYPRLTINGRPEFSQLVSTVTSQRELLQEFFETGLLPWWAGDEAEAPDVDAMLMELLEKEPVGTVQWLRGLAKLSPAVLQRIEMQVERAAREKIIAAAPTGTVAAIREIVRQMQQLRKTGNTAASIEAEERAVFLAVLALRDDAFQLPAPAGKPVVAPLIRIIGAVTGTSPGIVREQLYAGLLSETIAEKKTLAVNPALAQELVRWEKELPVSAVTISQTEQPVLEILLDEGEATIGKLADIIEQGLKNYEARRRQLAESLKRKPARRRKAAQPGKAKKAKNIPGPFSAPEEQQELEAIPGEPRVIIDPEQTSLPGEPVAKTFRSKDLAGNETPASPGKPKKKITSVDKIERTALAEKPSAETKEKRSEPQVPEHVNENVSEAIAVNEEKRPEEINPYAEILEDHPMLQKKPSAGMTRFGGLVLIAPFLPAFFNELKLVTDGQFPGDAERHKAVHLLNFIASGKTKAPEYALLLHKLLCGMEITAPVPKTVKLGAAEKKEALFLLDDIAEQWTALRGSSGEAIRATFMRRNGIIEKKENAWLLRVEKAPMDIMLDTFPWSISIIKAPWMQQLLHVEW